MKTIKVKTRRVSPRSFSGFTIPTRILRRINAKPGDYVKLTIKKGISRGYYYVQIPTLCPSRTNLQVKRAIPQEITQRLKINRGEKIMINEISLIKNLRSDSLIQNGKLDVLATIPEKTKTGKSIMVDVFNKSKEEWCRIWYSSGHGGKPKQIELRRFIEIDKQLGEFFGLMQAESRKRGKKFDFTNNLLSEHGLFMNVSERFGIPRDMWKYQLFYNPKMSKKYVKKYDLIFQKTFNTNQRIIHTKSKTISKIAFTSYIDNTLLAQIMTSLLTKLRSKIARLAEKNNLKNELKDFAIGFIVKDLIGDGTVIYGTVIYNKANGGTTVIIFEKDSISQKDITDIVNFFNIRTNIIRNKIYLSTKLDTILFLLENKAFEGHDNRKKLIQRALDNHFTVYLYKRLKSNNCFTEEEFVKKHNLTPQSARVYLRRCIKRGYLNLDPSKKIYKLTNKGINFVNIMKNAEEELKLILSTHQEELIS